MRAANSRLLVLVLLADLTLVRAGQTQDPAPAAIRPQGLTIEVLDGMTHLPGGLAALPEPPIPPGNPQTATTIELGRKLSRSGEGVFR